MYKLCTTECMMKLYELTVYCAYHVGIVSLNQAEGKCIINFKYVQWAVMQHAYICGLTVAFWLRSYIIRKYALLHTVTGSVLAHMQGYGCFSVFLLSPTLNYSFVGVFVCVFAFGSWFHSSFAFQSAPLSRFPSGCISFPSFCVWMCGGGGSLSSCTFCFFIFFTSVFLF